MKSTVSNTELSELLALTELWGENSVNFFSLLFVCQSELTEFFAELSEFGVELSEFSLLKQYSRNTIPPISYIESFGFGHIAKDPASAAAENQLHTCATPSNHKSITYKRKSESTSSRTYNSHAEILDKVLRSGNPIDIEL